MSMQLSHILLSLRLPFNIIVYSVLYMHLQIVIAIFSFVYGNPLRVINGYDSFGNTCGVKKNEHYTNFPLSGMNTIDKPQLFYFDVRKLKESIKICVKECPSKTLTNQQELYKYFQDYQTKFCRYDFDMNLISNEATGNLNQFFNHLGPCPQFPVYER